MKYQRLNVHDHARRFALVGEVDDDVPQMLQRFCERENVMSAAISGIGGFARATLAFYDLESKRYEPIEIAWQVEVLSLLGNVTRYQDKPKIHAHCVVGHRDGHTTGGHLLAATVRPTLELFIDEVPFDLQRTDRPEIGIPLIAL